MSEQTFLLVASVSTDAILQFDPSQANLNGFDENGFQDAFVEGNSSILLFDAQTGQFIDTVVSAGTEEANISVASGIAIGPDGLLYALDQANNSVKRFDVATGDFIGTFIESDSTEIDSTELVRPEGIIFDPEGEDLYVSSLAAGGVRRYDSQTGEFISTVADTNFNGAPLAAAGLTFDDEGNLYIGSVFNDNSILQFDPDTEEVEVFISPDEAQPIPSFPIFGLDGNFLNSTFSSEAIGFPPTDVRRYDGETGEFLDVFIEPGNNLEQASRLRLGPDNNIYVSSFGSDRVLRYDGENGEFIDEFISPNTGGLANPGGMTFFDVDLEPENIFGTTGDDVIEVDFEALDSEQLLPTPKQVFGGEGADLIDAASLSQNISLENRLYGQSGNDELIAGYNDILIGGSGNDTLDASSAGGENRLYGNSGDDTFFLGESDRLIGGAGDDSFFTLSGGGNTITGGAGADAFWIASAEIVDSANIITDFEAVDVIGVGGLGIASQNELNLFQDGDSVSIGFNDAEIARLQNTQLDSLNANNFVFA